MIKVERGVVERFPGLRVTLRLIEGVHVEPSSSELDELREAVVKQVKASFTAEELKDHPVFKAYRSFFWQIGIDPTKTRPAGEALVRRTLIGKPLPKINTLVDAYNMASLRTGVALAAFDLSKLTPPLTLRFAKPGESFKGIGMAEAKRLRGGEVVISDGRNRLVAIYPYRDADESKVTLETCDVLLLTCGVPGLELNVLEEAEELAVNYIVKFCGGSATKRWVAP